LSFKSYIYIYIEVTSKHAHIRLLRCVQIATLSVPYFRSFTLSNTTRVQPSYQWTVQVRAICRQSEHALLSSVHMAPSCGRTSNSLLCGSVKACFYIYIYKIYIYKSFIQTRAYSPAALCPNCNAIGALLSELYAFEQTAVKRTVTFLYVYRCWQSTHWINSFV
jgi:hypothetical protein